MLEARFQLERLERRDAEVVEEVLAELELGQALSRKQQQHGLQRQIALAQAAAQREPAVGVFVGADDRPRPPLVGLEPRRGVGRGGRLPRPTPEVECLRHRRRRRIREEE
jgi:hypothetical protein